MVIILDEIRWLIDSFLDKTPRPIQILIFLLMLVGLVSLIPFFLHLIGFHCNTDAEVIKTTPLSFITNLRIAYIGADDYINTSSYIPQPSSIVVSCRKPVCYVNGSYYYESTSYCDGQTIIYPLLTTRATWSQCSICDGEVNYTGIRSIGGFVSESFYLCHGDAYHINQSDRNWYQSWVCDEGEDCTVPKYYKYEYDTGTFDCIYLEICGLNNTQIISEMDSLLDQAEGELFYPDISEKDYRKAVSIKCDRKFEPQITFFGLPIFDYKVWLLLIVIYVMFMFLSNIVKH